MTGRPSVHDEAFNPGLRKLTDDAPRWLPALGAAFIATGRCLPRHVADCAGVA
jgi:hypothetical protein